MCKTLKFAVLFVFFLLMLSSCASLGGGHKKYPIESAIKAAAQEISTRVYGISDPIACVCISTPRTTLDPQIITWLETELLSFRRFTLVSRQRVDAIISELNLELSGFYNDDQISSFGRLTGAKFVIFCELKRISDIIFLNVQLLETETAVLLYSNSFIVSNVSLRQ
jgi:hypothetical protein